MLTLLLLSILPALLLAPCRASACTTVIAGKNRTMSGGIIHAHLEDMGTDAVGKVWRKERAFHPAGATIKVPYDTIPLPEKTFAYWAAGNADNAVGLGINAGSAPYNDVLVGFNENNVVISCNWCYSKEKNLLESGLRRYVLRQLLLEQAEGARHGVDLLANWIDRYGQADWGGLQFQISDSDEAWVVETTSRHWVARKIADDEIYVMANRFMIGEKFDLSSPDLISFAVNNGWHDQAAQFHFANAYSLPQRRNSPYDTDREQRIRLLFSKKNGKLGVRDILDIFQDRYEGTGLFRIPDNNIQIWEEEAERNNRPRPICTNLAQSFFTAAHAAKTAENEFVFFLGLGTPGYSGIFPLYPESTRIDPAYYTEENGAPFVWRICREIQRRADRNYPRFSNAVKKRWEEYNLAVLERVSGVKAGDKDNVTVKESRKNFSYAKTILAELSMAET